MTKQSTVRCVEAVRDEPSLDKERASEPVRLDAAAQIQRLSAEIERAPLVYVDREKMRSRLFHRVRLCLMGASLSVLIGGLAGTLHWL